MTIKRGTLVEITMKGELFGHRFIIGDSHIADTLYSDSGAVIDRNVKVYHAPFDFSLPEVPRMLSAFREQDLRIINPDGDRLSDKSYEEIMVLLRAGDVTKYKEYLHRTENQDSSHNTRKRAEINLNDLKTAAANSVSFIFGSNRQVKLDRFLRK